MSQQPDTKAPPGRPEASRRSASRSSRRVKRESRHWPWDLPALKPISLGPIQIGSLTVTALAKALESKDAETRAHSQRVRRYAIELVSVVEPRLLQDPSVECGFLLHDVGKLAIPDAVLLKPSRLDPEERAMIERHTVIGQEILSEAAFRGEVGLQIVRSHHERWDGAGYPDGLHENEIPLGARVFSVVDALDAITSDRPYRPARTWREASNEIERESGGQFDPAVVKVARALEPRLSRIQRETGSGCGPPGVSLR